ncbi:MAG TPA: GntR family transcriptional regulator [Acidimicrobiales bacterium]|nr:GntR family transcriptional regulator [Acidimicrobiales bacterium]
MLRSDVDPTSPDAGPVDQVVAQLRSWIMDGSLLPGVQLRQEEMADLLQVSRLPVREALRILTEQELLEYRRHRGYFVARREKDDIAQINRMLDLLEPELIRTARWPTAEELATLRRLNAEMEELVMSDEAARFINLNRTFHFTIFSLSPLTVIFGEVNRLWTMIDANTARSLASPEGKKRTLKEHRAIIRALEKKSLADALRTSELHRMSTYTSGLGGLG